MTSKYPRIYRRLKAIGLSPAKALEIIFDAYRGCPVALSWIKMVRKFS